MSEDTDNQSNEENNAQLETVVGEEEGWREWI